MTATPEVDPKFTLQELCDELWKMMRHFRSSVRTHSAHPSYVTKAHLKKDYNRIATIFGFLLKMNHYNELPSGIREEVTRCEMIVEAMYAKDRLKNKE